MCMYIYIYIYVYIYIYIVIIIIINVTMRPLAQMGQGRGRSDLQSGGDLIHRFYFTERGRSDFTEQGKRFYRAGENLFGSRAGQI